MVDLYSSPVCDWLEGSVGHSISAVEAYVGQCVAVLHGVFVCVYRAVAYSGSPPAFSFRVREESGGGGREGEDRVRSRL